MKQGILLVATAILVIGPVLGLAQSEQTDIPDSLAGGIMPVSSSAILAVDAKICSGIEERQPVGVTDRFGSDVEQIFLWSKITGAADSTAITHVWIYEGKEMARVELPVKSASWRAWTSKKILPSWMGEWEAQVIGPDGVVMATIRFNIAIEMESGKDTIE